MSQDIYADFVRINNTACIEVIIYLLFSIDRFWKFFSNTPDSGLIQDLGGEDLRVTQGPTRK